MTPVTRRARARYVLDGLLAAILERVGEAVPHLLVSDAGHADAARLRQAFEARGDVDVVAEDVLAVGDDVAEMDADAEADALALGPVELPPRHGALDLDRGLDRADHGRELDQSAVAHQLDDPAAVAGNRGLDQPLPDRLEAADGAPLVLPGQARIAHHVRREHGGEPAIGVRCGHGLPFIPKAPF